MKLFINSVQNMLSTKYKILLQVSIIYVTSKLFFNISVISPNQIRLKDIMTIKEFKIKLLPLKNKLFHLSLRILNNRDDAEDIVQDVYIKIWKMQNKLDDLNNIEAFMMTVTRNLCLDKIKNKRNKFLSLNEEVVKHTESNPHDITEQADLVKKVKEVMQRLPEQQRTIIHLRDIDGYNFEEITEITGWDLNYLRVNLSRGRKKIKETIQKLQHHEPARY